MPELPEVETTRRGVEPWVVGNIILSSWHSSKNMRYPWPRALRNLNGQQVVATKRRAKYLLFELADGSHLIIHLGMSGMVRISQATENKITHDHLVLDFVDGLSLVLNDPRRFGFVLWERGQLDDLPLFSKLGPEPFDPQFDGGHLKKAASGRKITVKALIMSNSVVVGVGNIYASEALFLAKINPYRSANNISFERYQRLAEAIVSVLKKAIEAGGTTLKNFRKSDGKPGYFQQQLNVYGRQGMDCFQCHTLISMKQINRRATYHCPKCQHY